MSKSCIAKVVCVLLLLAPADPSRGAPHPHETQTAAKSKAKSARVVAWESRRLHDQFMTEGGSIGDIDGDGNMDVVSGPLWYPGPKFDRPIVFAEPKTFPTQGYSDNFFSHVTDVDNDGDGDVLVVGFPGQPARLYQNLRDRGTDADPHPWAVFSITDAVDNESPHIVDLVSGGLPEIVCGRDGSYGYYQAGDDPTKPWKWTAVTRPGTCPHRFTHGMGVGDVDGDGRLDLLDSKHWWKQPDSHSQQRWSESTWNPAGMPGGAQICVSDLDGDGDADIVSSIAAHAYGLAWFENTGQAAFTRHDILGESSTDNPYGVCFSQMHAVALEDIDGDGRDDIVTGKRPLAHGGKDPGGLQEPVLYWFANRVRGDSIEFVPVEIDNASGVGVEVAVGDLNADGRPDIVSSNKRGLVLHFQNVLPNQGIAPEHAANVFPARWTDRPEHDQQTYKRGMSPAQAAAAMRVPEGFSVDLLLSEPDLTQPIAMTFDDAGRLWVVEGLTYPKRAAKGQGRDRILIFEDADADGSFETRKIFADQLNLVSGIAVGFDGVWVGAAPELLFIPDADKDDVPDGPPQVLLDGWGYQDTHETLNSLTWGPDGWLYGCHGVFTHSKVGKPGTPDALRTPLNAGVWRYHPTRHCFEVFAHGTSNPWGVDFDKHGEAFITACVIPHLYHLSPGGRYQRQAGQHFNAATYDDIKTIADHAHFAGNIREHAFWGDNFTERRPAPLDTSQLGGGHAHCGLAIYNGGVFPKRYDGRLLFHNLHGHRIVSERVRHDGSGYIGLHAPDFAYSMDHQQIGVGIMVGPDGAIYTSDWHDDQTCHHRDPEIWNRSDGRVFRIRYGDVRPLRFNLQTMTDASLLEHLNHENEFFARRAQRVLQERAAAGTLDQSLVRESLKQQIEPDQPLPLRLRGLWAAWVTGLVDDDWSKELLRDSDPVVRGWMVRLISQRADPLDPEMTGILVQMAKTQSHSVVRRQLASAAIRLGPQTPAAWVEGLALGGVDSNDRNLAYLIWYAMEPLVPQKPDWALKVAQRSRFSKLEPFVIRLMAETPAGRETLAGRLATLRFDGKDSAKSRAFANQVLKQITAASRKRGGVDAPELWPQAATNLLSNGDAALVAATRTLSIEMGDASAAPWLRDRVADGDRPTHERADALRGLVQIRDEGIHDRLVHLLDDTELASVAATLLADVFQEQTPGILLAKLPDLDSATGNAVMSTLASRPAGALALVDAMTDGRVAAKTVRAATVVDLIRVAPETEATLSKIWGRVRPSDEQKKQQLKAYQKKLRERWVAAADVHRGRSLFDANCGQCHRLFGSGGKIGPEITGANRSSIDYWLENILDPSSVVPKEYAVTKVITFEGRVVTGMVSNENADALTLVPQTGETIVIRKDDIQQRRPSKMSLMPEGQLEVLSDADVRSLMRYLMSPVQVDPEVAFSDTTAGNDPVHVIEAESLAATATGGHLRAQGMKSFGPDWSGGSHLWWTGGTVGDVARVSIALPSDSAHQSGDSIQQSGDSIHTLGDSGGRFDVRVHWTAAPDYARVGATIDGQPPVDADDAASGRGSASAGGRKRSVIDLYDPVVSSGGTSVWRNIRMDGKQPPELAIEIVGNHPEARPAKMVGIDRIEILPHR